MAKRQPVYGELSYIPMLMFIPILLYLMLGHLPVPGSLILIFFIIIAAVSYIILVIILQTWQKYRANKLITLTSVTAELHTNKNAELELNESCRQCESRRIIKGKLTENKTVFLESPDLKFYSRFWARSVTDGMPKPLYEIEDVYFNYCIDCGHLGGFASVEMLQLSIKSHATDMTLRRLNLVNDLEQKCEEIA